MRSLVHALAGVVSVAAIALGACVSDAPVSGGDGGADGGSCAKQCNGACATATDPATGCAGASCDPCPAGPNQTATCQAGACGVACGAGYADCDPNAAGCETNVGTNTSNCGKCGNVCGTANATAVSCSSGQGDAGTDGGAPAGCSFVCTGAYAHCSADDSTGCETNVGTDKNNCGACGRSCGGGECVAGFCQPVILAGDPTKNTGLKSLYGITALNGYIYGTNWETNAGLVYKVSTTPGSPFTWLTGAGLKAAADFIATDGTSLTYSIYHTGDAQPAGLWNVQTDGSKNTDVVPGGTQGGGPACGLSSAYGYEIAGIAFDSGYVYWTRDTYGACFPSTPSCQCQGIYRANADGTGVKQYFTSNWYTVPLADSGTLYMVDYFNAQVVAATSQTFTNNAAPIALPKGGTPATLQTDATYVYWIDPTARKFYRALKVGATTADDITPASGMPGTALAPQFLADATHIYFVSPPSTPNAAVTQQIYVMAKDGTGAAKPIPGALISAYGDSLSTLAQDSGAIYWTTYGYDAVVQPFSAVYKLAK